MLSLPPPAQAGVVFCYALVALIASQFLGGWRALAGIMAITVAYVAMAVALFVLARLWLPIAIPLMIVAPIAVLSAFSARFAGARRIVERLAPRPFARALLRHPEIGRGDSSIEDQAYAFRDDLRHDRAGQRRPRPSLPPPCLPAPSPRPSRRSAVARPAPRARISARSPCSGALAPS